METTKVNGIELALFLKNVRFWFEAHGFCFAEMREQVRARLSSVSDAEFGPAWFAAAL